MDFKKKLKIRLWVAITYILLGVAMIVVGLVVGSKNDILSSFGFAIALIGCVRLRNYFLITKDEERIKAQEIAEKDERNIAIADKAKSFAFTTFVLLACIAVIVLHLLKKTQWALVLSSGVCVLLVLYWVGYYIIRKKH